MTHVEVKSLDVILENEQRDGYCSGEVVSGHISLKLSETTTVKTIKILLKGNTQVSWVHKRSRFSEERKCLLLSKTLVATTDTRDLIFDSGTYEIPFDLQLPQSSLVSSFSGKNGCVYYMMQAVLKRPFHESQCVNRELRIVCHIDVSVPTLISPVSQTCKKMIGCWIFTSGPISLTASIERQGYCNGESIPIYALIENRSCCLVVPKAVIYQIQTYTAKGKTKSIKQLVASARGNPVASDTTSRWNGNPLKIPPVSPSILNSDILRLEYLLAGRPNCPERLLNSRRVTHLALREIADLYSYCSDTRCQKSRSATSSGDWYQWSWHEQSFFCEHELAIPHIYPSRHT
ncbi:arrestin domain-containing protein 4 isoform X3 [Carassius gibelio]|uniref:arrestin domain-containing protein 4 isoform X3 n=1 Tax=Carassius gibelio TaxID=101364 RepID=UPI0022786B0E|nr:arrestin domain-containing protein 4 isoform X3 [Carassius gibelio]